jgi:hypothetical protein
MLCSACHREIGSIPGCLIKEVALDDGDVMSRIPFNGNLDRCNDCGVTSGKVHHQDCSQEECPSCYEQLITCGCLFSE